MLVCYSVSWIKSPFLLIRLESKQRPNIKEHPCLRKFYIFHILEHLGTEASPGFPEMLEMCPCLWLGCALAGSWLHREERHLKSVSMFVPSMLLTSGEPARRASVFSAFPFPSEQPWFPAVIQKCMMKDMGLNVHLLPPCAAQNDVLLLQQKGQSRAIFFSVPYFNTSLIFGVCFSFKAFK